MKEIVIGIVVFIAVVSGVGYLANTGTKQGEIDECHKWQEEAAQFPGFYLVEWQAAQCKAHNININAPVK